MIATILEIFLPMALKALDLWIQKSAKNKEMIDSYYNFLKQIDQSGALNVKQYLSSEEALKQKQEELRKEIEGKK